MITFLFPPVVAIFEKVQVWAKSKMKDTDIKSKGKKFWRFCDINSKFDGFPAAEKNICGFSGLRATQIQHKK